MTLLAGVADLRFLHFQPEIGPLAGSLPHAGEHRIPAVLLRDSGDQFLNDDRLAQPRPAEQSRLAAAKERRQQIDHLDPRLKHFRLGRQIHKLRRLAMNRPARLHMHRTADCRSAPPAD